jgi:hypothetical protein
MVARPIHGGSMRSDYSKPDDVSAAELPDASVS